MAINGIAIGYFPTGYVNNKAAKAETGKTFAEIASQKMEEAEKETAQKKIPQIIDLFGTNAPDEVKQAWMEAEKETGVHITKCGLYITPDGEHSYMTAAGVQIAIKWSKGELNQTDLLGSSVESAINAVNKWIYDLDHPLAGQSAKSIDEQRLMMNERAFYELFLEKLTHLVGQDQQNQSSGL